MPHESPEIQDDLTHVHCAVCGCTYLPPMLACPKCGVLRSESHEVASIRREMGKAGFHVPLPPPDTTASSPRSTR